MTLGIIGIIGIIMQRKRKVAYYITLGLRQENKKDICKLLDILHYEIDSFFEKDKILKNRA